MFLEANFTEAELDILFSVDEPTQQRLDDFIDNGVCDLDPDRCTPLILAKLCVEYGVSFRIGWREYQYCWC